MNIKSWIIIIVFVIWGCLSWQWYTCVIKGFCFLETLYDEEETVQAYDPPFTFSKSSFVCIKGKGLQNYIDSLKKLMEDGRTVTITGLYDTSEINKSKFPNLGLARAIRIKSLLAMDVDTSKILTRARFFDSGIPKDPFIAHLTDVDIVEIADSSEVVIENPTSETSKTEIEKPTPIENQPKKEYTTLVVENGFSITFGHNSVRKDASTETDNYLNNLAEELKSNGKKIYITGHIDNTENEKLDRIRAWVIKSELLERGVESAQLITAGKGSSQPIGDNNTPEGRHKNRRVILK